MAPWPEGTESEEGIAIFERLKAFISKHGADGIRVAGICRRAGISQATYFNRKRKYDGPLPMAMKRLKQPEDGSGKLRKLVANLSLDNELLQDVIH